MASFWPKLTVFSVFDLQLPNAAMNLPNFWHGSCSYGFLWENHTLYAWKILILRNFGHFLAKLTVLRVFDLYNFQTQLWIFLIFGMELLWILTLSGEPIILCLVLKLLDFAETCTIPNFLTSLNFDFPGMQSYCVLLLLY